MDYVRIMLLEDSDSEDELELLTAIVLAHKYFNREGGSTSRRGSVPGRTYIDRDFLQGHQRLFLDYFADSPVYPPKSISKEVSDASSSFSSYSICGRSL
jgi:hypothetical protein